MNDDEAVLIIGYLNAAFPNNKLDDSAAKVFINFLKPFEFEAARYATKRWIENSKWFPSIAELAEVTRNEMRRTSQVPALPEGGRFLTREENQARLAEIQAQIANAKGPLFNERVRSRVLGPPAGQPPTPSPPPARPGRTSPPPPAPPPPPPSASEHPDQP